jgi:hypothetical protein
VQVCVKNVGVNSFPLVARLFWLPALQPGANMVVSGVQAVHVAAERQVRPRSHNQTGII